MATSIITAASSADHHHHRRAASPGPHEHGRRGAAPPRRGPGRRKGRNGGDGGPRRRGMGVEKLEKLMMQDRWRKAAEAGQFPDPVSDTAGYGSPAGFKYGGGSDQIGSGAAGSCYSEHCTACHKKKKFDSGDYGILGVNSEEAHERLNIGTKMTLGTGFANSGKQQIKL
ncbi:PRP38 family protein [Striga asiatica]|uniref:PRP38 family protein n=1 Tax=Striga asiatica TaxID=4170 RepID=A0A5A7R8Z1_STRAF|nr:PRP38 family protein [Striga asiatica]